MAQAASGRTAISSAADERAIRDTFRRRRARVGHAIGNADAAEAAAGHEQARASRASARSMRLDAGQVSDFVLRAGALEAIDARQQRLAA